MPKVRQLVWGLVVLCSSASAQPVKRAHLYAVPAQTLSAAAARIAAPFGTITSTFRTVEHNRAVGGVPDSYHLLGQAIDVVRRPGVSHAQIAAALAAAGFRLIESLDEGSHSHFAFRVARTSAPVSPYSLQPVGPSSPQPIVKNLLAADEHGTLRIDLQRHRQPPGISLRGRAAHRRIVR